MGKVLKKIHRVLDKIKRIIFFWYNEFDDIDIIHRSTSSNSSSSSQDIDNSFCFDDKTYIVQKYNITSELFDFADLGKFVTDIDGICLYLNKKTSEYIGKPKRKIRFNPIWQYNVFKEDIPKVNKIWDTSLNNQSVIIYKERRMLNNFSPGQKDPKIAYLIVEAYRLESRGYYKGFKGIIMRVTKPIWNRFDETYVHIKFIPKQLSTRHYGESDDDKDQLLNIEPNKFLRNRRKKKEMLHYDHQYPSSAPHSPWRRSPLQKKIESCPQSPNRSKIAIALHISDKKLEHNQLIPIPDKVKKSPLSIFIANANELHK